MSRTRTAALVLSALVLSSTLSVPQASSEPQEAPTPTPVLSEPSEPHTAGLTIVYLTSHEDVEGEPEDLPTTTTTTEAPKYSTTTEAPHVAVETANSGAGDPTLDSTWDQLMGCESGGKGWAVNTGNGYYGGLQFDLPSWRSAGGTGYPHQASREEQIKRGRIWYAANGGWQSWPACTRKFGWR